VGRRLVDLAKDVAGGRLGDHERRFVTDIIERLVQDYWHVTRLSEKQMGWLLALHQRKLLRDATNARVRVILGQAPHAPSPAPLPLQRDPLGR
jgi:hypothetical protein